MRKYLEINNNAAFKLFHGLHQDLRPRSAWVISGGGGTGVLPEGPWQRPHLYLGDHEEEAGWAGRVPAVRVVPPR